MSYKRLEQGRFIWPSPADGIVAITPSQLAYLLDGIEMTLRVRFAQAHAPAQLAADRRRLKIRGYKRLRI
ncbi:hypothetical protein DF3PA_200030 [Candidatus Defluviicoccus seviourii]|uniref:Transposase n=1 Tax=Candidatus Defluviicoccus seviourii TaxID=2565273 RepID=A0A564WEE2_9PROT|nr:hypothetical protein DF3PA_200030 [Candidatus Defluviicoccus seviourii]